MARGTIVFIRDRKVRLRVKKRRYFLFFEAMIAKKKVRRKKQVKMISRLPDRALKINQIAEDKAMAEDMPTRGLNSFLPKKYSSIMLIIPEKADGNLVQNSSVPKAL